MTQIAGYQKNRLPKLDFVFSKLCEVSPDAADAAFGFRTGLVYTFVIGYVLIYLIFSTARSQKEEARSTGTVGI